jgi:hypothetical protein
VSTPDASKAARDVIMRCLPESWSEKRRTALTEELMEALDVAGVLLPEDFDSVVVRGALVTTQTVHDYGLEIELDAVGDATRITHTTGWLEIRP